MKYKVALQRSEEGYSVSVPGLPGCSSQGVTEQQALENIREPIREYLAVATELAQGAEVREVEVVVWAVAKLRRHFRFGDSATRSACCSSLVARAKVRA